MISEKKLPAGTSTLRVAIEQERDELIPVLLDAGADSVLEPGLTAVCFALQTGRRKSVSALLTVPRGFTWDDSLHCIQALLRGPHDDPALLEELLARELRPTWVLDGKPLEHLIVESGHIALADALFRTYPLNVNRADPAGWTPLMCAASSGNCAMAELLLRHRARLNTQAFGQERVAALHVAVNSDGDRASMVRLLVERGCNTRLVDTHGRTAAEHAAETGQPELAALIAELAPLSGPRWHRDAVAKNHTQVIEIFYDKANGLLFDPDDVDQPFLVGGDHDGAYPADPASALEYIRQFPPRSWEAGRAASFIPLIEKMLRGEDFPLKLAARLGKARPRP